MYALVKASILRPKNWGLKSTTSFQSATSDREVNPNGFHKKRVIKIFFLLSMQLCNFVSDEALILPKQMFIISEIGSEVCIIVANRKFFKRSSNKTKLH